MVSKFIFMKGLILLSSDVKKNIFELWSLFHGLKHFVIGDISGQIILLEISKSFSETVSNEKNIKKV